MKNYHAPNGQGFFGEHGGLYVSETLIPALKELAAAYAEAKNDPAFWEEFRHDLKHYVSTVPALFTMQNVCRHIWAVRRFG
ncbi:hypothetical protein LVJ84_10070 [Kingella potus]|nr:hypothetical protein LVJ84_10070 [Kingella potus]